MKTLIERIASMRTLSVCLALLAAPLLSACGGLLDDGGVNVVEPPPGAEEEDGLGLEIPTIPIPGASAWQPGRSGDYDFFSAEVVDVDHDAHDCILNDISTSGMDLHKVEATIWHDPNGASWFPELTLILLPPAGAAPDQLIQWAVEIQNSLGILLINQWGEMDGDEFDGALPESSLWSTTDTGEVGVSLRPEADFDTPDRAVEALVPWFLNLLVSVRTDAAGGAVCDELDAPPAKSR